MDQSLGEVLMSKNLISREEWLNSQKEAEDKNISIEEALQAKGIQENELFEAKSEILNIPLKSLKNFRVSFDVLKYVLEDTARLYKFVPLNFTDGVLEFGMVAPDDLKAREVLRFIVSKSNIPFKIYLITNSDLEDVLKEYKGLGGEARRVLGDLETMLGDKREVQKIPGIDQEKITEGEAKEEIMQSISEEAPIVKMVGIIIRHAIEGKASDIHIEPFRGKVRVRYRMDGILYTSLFLPISVHEAIVSRVKILTNMLLDEKRKPQDGRFSIKFENRNIDFRASSLPTQFGEKIVLRILDPEKQSVSLETVGLSGRNLEAVERALNKPFGLILITGPTGSGKTTTLYAMLQKLNVEGKNIISLEDPIEYHIEGVNQSQIRPEIGYDFANGLRTILRQDPDIIMVGEIRDKETAGLAIHAALTGHVVLSTLHTNTAIGAIPRLMDMEVDPYLIAPTLIMSISQRLVRTLCEDSKKPIPIKGVLKEKLEKELENMPLRIKEKIKLPKEIYQALPSAVCPKGTRGRIGIFEVFEVTKEIESMIAVKPVMQDIEKEARNQGMVSLKEDGILKVFEGKIGLEELSDIAEV